MNNLNIDINTICDLFGLKLEIKTKAGQTNIERVYTEVKEYPFGEDWFEVLYGNIRKQKSIEDEHCPSFQELYTATVFYLLEKGFALLTTQRDINKTEWIEEIFFSGSDRVVFKIEKI